MLHRSFATSLLLLLALSTALAASDTASHPACFHCGMDRQKFAQSRMLLTFEDGSEVGTCSLRCAAVEYAVSIGKALRRIEVADYSTRELVDAEHAAWVILPGTPGVMTGNAKWAFREPEAARELAARSGGRVVSFAEALESAFADLYQDTRRTREKRRNR